MIEDALYSIETNLEFPTSLVSATPELCEVLDAFGYVSLYEVRVVKKTNSNSSIYFCSCVGEELVVRSSDVSHGSMLEVQCQILDSLPDGAGLRPLMNRFGNYCFHSKDKVWIVYPYIRGVLFDGNDKIGQVVLRQCLDVIENLRRIRIAEDQRELLPRVNFDADGWYRSIEFFCAPNDEDVTSALGPDLYFFLVTARGPLLDLVDRLAKRKLPVSEITHYDLQHANVVVTPYGPQIIDLEDIYFAPPLVSACHAAFKLARHIVFADRVKRRSVMRGVIPAFMRQLEPFGVKRLVDLFEISAIRTINDLNGIRVNILENNQLAVLYDLRKKMLNLFEVADLTDCRKQVGLT